MVANHIINRSYDRPTDQEMRLVFSLDRYTLFTIDGCLKRDSIFYS